ncbi:MAG TPA: hypothetical protein VLJ86_01370 [Ramlibacter sp.]|nr:hypothetical protein [Ramlibacter sp.]
MLVGNLGADATLENALSQPRAFGLSQAGTRKIAAEMARHVDGWKAHFKRLGVVDVDIELLAQYIDGERLGAKRRDMQ